MKNLLVKDLPKQLRDEIFSYYESGQSNKNAFYIMCDLRMIFKNKELNKALPPNPKLAKKIGDYLKK